MSTNTTDSSVGNILIRDEPFDLPVICLTFGDDKLYVARDLIKRALPQVFNTSNNMADTTSFDLEIDGHGPVDKKEVLGFIKDIFVGVFSPKDHKSVEYNPPSFIVDRFILLKFIDMYINTEYVEIVNDITCKLTNIKFVNEYSVETCVEVLLTKGIHGIDESRCGEKYSILRSAVEYLLKETHLNKLFYLSETANRSNMMGYVYSNGEVFLDLPVNIPSKMINIYEKYYSMIIDIANHFGVSKNHADVIIDPDWPEVVYYCKKYRLIASDVIECIKDDIS